MDPNEAGMTGGSGHDVTDRARERLELASETIARTEGGPRDGGGVVNRRDALAGLGSLGVLGTGAIIASGGLDERFREDAVPETTLETLPASGSEAGEAVVPERGSVTFVDFFATWCTDCRQHMGTLTEFHDRVPEDVQFVSVTTEQVGSATTRDGVRHWWNRNLGGWTLAIDPSLSLAEPIGATYVPHSFVLDERNRLVWGDSGLHGVDDLEAALTETGAVKR